MFNYENLDDKTRKFMVEAIEEAEKTKNIYYSARFNSSGNQRWVPLLKEQQMIIMNIGWLSVGSKCINERF